jgi:predicted flap endonuclease-1-like 5' DNA nuclease
VQDVPASLAVELLTTPEDEFVVAADAEPLTGLHGVGPQRAAELALAGIGSLTDLAALDEDGIARLAEGIWASARQVEGWVAAARAAPAQDGGNES